MPLKFKYKAVDLGGEVVEGHQVAETKDEVLSLLRSRGHTPVRVQSVEQQGTDVSDMTLFLPKVKSKDLAVFTKQLYTMLNAGMPLLTSLEVLEQQSENRTLREALDDMATEVRKGEVLSIAMERHRKVFPPLLTNMVASGEMTGNLDGVLDKMSAHYDKETKINAKIKGALVYPAVLSIFAVTVVIFLLTFVMPTFIGMFEGSGVPLPGPTQVLIAISNSIQSFWYLYILAIGGIVYAIRKYIQTPEGKLRVDSVLLRLPIIGTSLKKIATSRFTRTLSTLIGSGIPIVEAIEASGNVTGNMVVIKRLERVTEDIKKGTSLSKLLKRMDIFPPMMISMVGIGEESGALEEMLGKTADFYDDELEASLQRMVTLLEPLMIIVMGLIVGFIVISMMLPLFDMLQTI